MAVTIGGNRMWHAQEDRLESDGRVRTDAVVGEDSGSTLLTGLESLETFEYTGETTGNRLSQQSGYSNDPLTALAEWVVEIETLVDGAQGTGHTLVDDERGRNINLVLEMIGWSRNQGEKYSVSWDFAGTWAQGAMPDYSRSIPNVNPVDGPEVIDGQNVTNIESKRVQKRQELEPFPIAYSDPGGDEVLSKSGALKTIFIRGKAVGTQTERNNFDDHFLNLVGQDNIVTYEDAFPGTSSKVMVSNYESTREAGLTRIGEYVIELTEGIGEAGNIL